MADTRRWQQPIHFHGPCPRSFVRRGFCWQWPPRASAPVPPRVHKRATDSPPPLFLYSSLRRSYAVLQPVHRSTASARTIVGENGAIPKRGAKWTTPGNFSCRVKKSVSPYLSRTMFNRTMIRAIQTRGAKWSRSEIQSNFEERFFYFVLFLMVQKTSSYLT